MSIFLIRHASAGRRTVGGNDIERPLDARGLDQAVRIADALDSANIDVVLTSPAVRCRQTVEPLAKIHGVEIELSDELWEGQGGRGALAIAQRLAAADTCAALCSHGDVIPRLLDLLVAMEVPLLGSGCAKGSIWALDTDQGTIASGRYQPQP